MKSVKELFDLSGRVAIVTGACGIIGRGLSHGLAELGARVAVVDVRATEAKELAAALSDSYGVEALGLGLDVSVQQDVDAIVIEASGLGPIRILLNNAATKGESRAAFLAPTEDYSMATWRAVNAVNVDGMFMMAQAAGRHMIAHGLGGSIVQTASIYGILGPDSRIYEGTLHEGHQASTPPVYASSKGAVIALTRYLATTWAPHGIRVNTLTPGGVRFGQKEEFLQRYSERVPMRRMAEAYELVGAAVYLASDASSYVTGQNIVVDGGLSAW